MEEFDFTLALEELESKYTKESVNTFKETYLAKARAVTERSFNTFVNRYQLFKKIEDDTTQKFYNYDYVFKKLKKDGIELSQRESDQLSFAIDEFLKVYKPSEIKTTLHAIVDYLKQKNIVKGANFIKALQKSKLNKELKLDIQNYEYVEEIDWLKG